MDSLFLACAGIGGTLIVCQFLLSLLGIGADHDADHDHDTDNDHDHGGWFVGFLTLRTLSAGAGFFGLGGLSARSLNWDEPQTLAFAVFCGIGAVYLVAKIMQFFRKLKADGSVDITAAVGQTGRVYLRIPAHNSGPGKVTLSLQNRTVECEAFSTANEIATGESIRVVAVRGPNSVEVEPLTGVPS